MISDFDMHPIEFRLLQVSCKGLIWNPSALNAQYLRLSEPYAWLMYRAHALSQDVRLIDPTLLRE